MELRKLNVLAAATLLGCVGASPALGNGYLFFHEHQFDEKEGTVYLGVVRDTAGKPVPGAQVSINIMSFSQAIVLATDALGRYRSTGVSKDIDPSEVKVAVVKRGYKPVKQVNLSRTAKPGAPVEINFTMAPAG